MECSVCRADRQSRRRVILHADGMGGADMEAVPCAVPNNDLRYEINKLRARLYAVRHGVQLLWAPAKDVVSVDALREDPTLPWKKKDWLSRHDRQCGDLLGMLPLAEGMRMLLTEHVDRDERYQMLKGTEVEVHCIQIEPEDEQACKGKDVGVLQRLPVCVYVRKVGATWNVAGLAA
eukprot:2491676-Pyramimonas_sp.AAC.1